jgi:hypothetical protein
MRPTGGEALVKRLCTSGTRLYRVWKKQHDYLDTLNNGSWNYLHFHGFAPPSKSFLVKCNIIPAHNKRTIDLSIIITLRLRSHISMSNAMYATLLSIHYAFHMLYQEFFGYQFFISVLYYVVSLKLNISD